MYAIVLAYGSHTPSDYSETSTRTEISEARRLLSEEASRYEEGGYLVTKVSDDEFVVNRDPLDPTKLKVVEIDVE